MQVFVRHDDDFRGTLTLHGLKTLSLFILQQPDDRGVGTDDDPLRLRTAADPTDVAEYLIGHRGRRLRIATPFAIVTGLGERTQEVLSHPFTRNLDQPQIGYSGAGLVRRHRIE